MSLEGQPRKPAEFIPGRPEGARARRLIEDTIHTQAYQVELPGGESIPVYPSDLAKEGIPWAGTETVTSDNPIYQRILEVAYRKKERMSTPHEERVEEPEVAPDAAAQTREANKSFVPGRESGAVAERIIKGEHGVFDIAEQRYRVRLSSGETVEIGPDDLAAEGIAIEGTKTIQPSDREYPNLIEAAYRKREGTTHAAQQAALEDALRNFVLVTQTDVVVEHGHAEAAEAEAKAEAPDAHVDGNESPHNSALGPAPGPEQSHDASPLPKQQHEQTEKEKLPEAGHGNHGGHESHGHEAGHGNHGGHESHGHDHAHGHGHGEPWHLPRDWYEWKEAGIALGLGIWYAIKGLFHLHKWMVEGTFYILMGDTKHPWQTLWKNVTGELKKALKFKGGGGGGGQESAGHGGGGHGGGHH